jgi:hypothetical protein
MKTLIVLTIEHKNKLPDDLLGGLLFKAYGLIGGDGDIFAEFVKPSEELRYEHIRRIIRGLAQADGLERICQICNR